tara:strand:- start:826 stop:1458 length:633 start_codon:yes stop_codon:yes gene_type:complete
MANEYTISELMQLSGLRGYTPRLAGALNTLLSTNSEIEYQQALKIASTTIKGYDNVQVYDDSNIKGQVESSFFGLPIYMPLVLEGIDGIEDYLFDSAFVEISRQKNIVITNVQGRDTSVKEFINNGDFTIAVTGIIAQKEIGYPKDLVSHFNEFMSYKGSIPIIHEVLNMLGINEIVITDYSLPADNLANAQQYSFNAINEVPALLRLEE